MAAAASPSRSRRTPPPIQSTFPQRRGVQRSFFCACGRPLDSRLSRCRSCAWEIPYSRRRFGGHRAAVLARDARRCRSCGAGNSCTYITAGPGSTNASGWSPCVRGVMPECIGWGRSGSGFPNPSLLSGKSSILTRRGSCNFLSSRTPDERSGSGSSRPGTAAGARPRPAEASAARGDLGSELPARLRPRFDGFFEWYLREPRGPFSKLVVEEYRDALATLRPRALDHQRPLKRHPKIGVASRRSRPAVVGAAPPAFSE